MGILMAHYEILFPTDISYGVRGGPAWNTSIIKRSSGHEQRIQRWSTPLWEYPDVAHHARSVSKMDDLYDFFITVGMGSANSFLLKDWADYTVLAADGRLGTLAIGTGEPTYQMVKRYTYGARTHDRNIVKPKASSVTVYRGGVAQTEGASAGNFSFDTTTGIVTFVADSSKAVNANETKTVSGITQAADGEVTTSAAHGFATGDKIKLTGVGGMTQVNGNYYTITVTATDKFTLGVNTSAYTAYTSGGSAIKYGITQTNPVRVNATAHGYTNGTVLYLSGIGGMTELATGAYTITNVATDYFELSGINGSAYTAYTSGATAYKYPQPSESLTFACTEFYVKARFDIDRMEREIIAPNVHGWQQIPIVETR
jgi:uncharacterized protein (TIGR02217 family)